MMPGLLAGGRDRFRVRSTRAACFVASLQVYFVPTPRYIRTLVRKLVESEDFVSWLARIRVFRRTTHTYY